MYKQAASLNLVNNDLALRNTHGRLYGGRTQFSTDEYKLKLKLRQRMRKGKHSKAEYFKTAEERQASQV